MPGQKTLPEPWERQPVCVDEDAERPGAEHGTHNPQPPCRAPGFGRSGGTCVGRPLPRGFRGPGSSGGLVPRQVSHSGWDFQSPR